MSKLVERECPNCGATIKIDSKLRVVKCEYCNNEFELSAPKNFDETSLISATSDGYIEEIKSLLDTSVRRAAGANIDAKFFMDYTALIKAASDGNMKKARMLHKSGLNKTLRIPKPIGCFSLLGTLGVIVFIIIFFVRGCS